MALIRTDTIFLGLHAPLYTELSAMSYCTGHTAWYHIIGSCDGRISFLDLKPIIVQVLSGLCLL